MINLGLKGFSQFNYDFRLAAENENWEVRGLTHLRKSKFYQSVAGVAEPPPGTDSGVFPVKYAVFIVLRLRAVGLV